VLTSARSQRIMTWASMGIVGILSFVGINSLLGFLDLSVGFLQR
jgi:hypothetical protein